MKKIILLLFTVISLSLFGQDNQVDSLTRLIKIASHDTVKIKLYQHLAEIDTDEKLAQHADEAALLIEKQLSILQKNSPAYFNILRFKAGNLENLGLVQQNKGDLSKAIDYHFQSLKIRESMQDKKSIGASLNNIGLIYSAMDQTDKALEFYEKSYDVCVKSGNTKMAAYALNGIADTYMHKQEYPKALKFYTKSMYMKKLINDKYGMSYSLNNIGVIYKKTGKLDSALFYFKKSLEMRKEINDRNGIVYSYINISRTLFVQNKLGEAKQFGEMALKISKELNFPNIIRYSADALQNIYEKQKKYEKAYEMLKISKEMGEIIVNDDTQKELLRKEMQYDYDKKNIADSIKTVEEKKLTSIKLKQEKNQRYLLYGGLALTLIFGGLMYNRFRITKKQKAIIEDQKRIVEKQKDIVEEKQKQVMDSIHYAKRIQQSLLPSEKYIEKQLTNIADKTNHRNG